MKTTNSSTPIIVGALSIASIVGAAGFVLTHTKPTATPSAANPATSQTAIKETTSQSTDTAAATADTTTNTSTTTNSSASSSGYKDGTYSASASYTVPHGYSNDLLVKLTVANGVVSSVSTDNTYSDRESQMYVDSFEREIKSAVVGKSLSSLTSLSRVGGASLTTYAFDDALATIANQAKA
jgi:uncharacterized protein with FMN-binding domain